ncbi:MAG: glycosyltransferase family A protein [Pseudomonadota bacterium]
MTADRPPLFTVFTPTYNRAHTLGRVHDSLAAQTLRDFEWLIVDDGSGDNTAELVAAWQAAADFPIRYIQQPNQGKHVAVNRGAAAARGELFLTLDSDDACLPQALERLAEHWLAIPEPERDHFAGVTARCLDQHGRPVGGHLPRPLMDISAHELRHLWRVRGELWGFTRTELVRAHPAPEPPGARFVPEDLIWSPIASRHLTRFVDEPLRVYHRGEADSLTRSGAPAGHLTGLMLWHCQTLNLEMTWFVYDPAHFLRAAVNYARFSAGLGLGLARQWLELTNARARLLWLLALIPGRALAALDRRRQRRARQG